MESVVPNCALSATDRDRLTRLLASVSSPTPVGGRAQALASAVRVGNP